MKTENKKTGTEWSPWDQPGPYLQLPHRVPACLAVLGFGPSEILVALGIVALLRPGDTSVVFSQKKISKYPMCDIRTVRRTVARMQSLGMDAIGKQGVLVIYDLRNFISHVKLNIPNLS